MIVSAVSVSRIFEMAAGPVAAVRDVTLSIEAGDHVAISGPSGCGKSTLLHMLGCVDAPSSGTLLFDGREVSTLGDRARSLLRLRQIGFVFQRFFLLPMLTAAENVELPQAEAGTSRSERHARTRELLEYVGLGARADHRPVGSTASGPFDSHHSPGDPSRRNQTVIRGEFVTRRPLLHIASIAATLMLVIAACSNAASQAPALTDPKEILAQTAASLKDVKTVELVGSLTGKVQAAELGGSLDLSSTTIAGAFDIPNQKAKLTIDAPALLSTKVEAIVVDGFAYVKIDGMLAGLAGLPSGKYVKTAVPQESGKPVTNPSEIAERYRAIYRE